MQQTSQIHDGETFFEYGLSPWELAGRGYVSDLPRWSSTQSRLVHPVDVR